MKITLVNYRYFVSGGPERYLFNIKEVLERNGNEVVVFSIKNSKNVPSEYEKYFLESVGDEEYFANTKKSFHNIRKSFSRMYYSREAKKKFAKLLDDTRPDIVYILQYHNKISPSILSAARKRGIPVVHRISDFQYMCPNALLYNSRKGVCEDCLHGHSLSCIKNKCVMDSRMLSALKLGAKRFHEIMGYPKKIDAFIVPSSFTTQKLKEYGIPADKLHHIPTLSGIKPKSENPEYQPYFLYIGRVEKQKGLSTLIDAFADTDYKLKIIGFSNNGYIDELKDRLKDRRHNIEFLGQMTFDEIEPLLNSCLCTVVPSEWYDNFPNAIIESFAFKKPVIATDFGSLPELVRNMETGLTFKYGDAEDLKRCVRYIAENPAEAKRMGQEAHNYLLRELTPASHYSKLMTVMETLVGRNTKNTEKDVSKQHS